MSNKERLEQNNVKIQQLIDLVQTKQSGNNAIRIDCAELPNRTLTLYKVTDSGDIEVEAKDTGDSGGKVSFFVSETGKYKIECQWSVKEDDQFFYYGWTSAETEINDIGVYNIKSGQALANYTPDEMHTALQGGYFSTMFSLKDTFTLVKSGNILNNHKFFVEKITAVNGKEIVDFRMTNQYSGGTYNINPRYAHLTSASATSWSNDYSNNGGYKYSVMRQRMMKMGENVYMQAQSIKPDDSTIDGGIPFSQMKYTDNSNVSAIYSYNKETDTMTPLSSWQAITNRETYFVKGYFKNVGTIDESTFNGGNYYTYNTRTYVYTPAITYTSGTTYYGFYETLQEDGIFADALNTAGFGSNLVRFNDKASAGMTQTTYVSEFNDYADIPAVEEITGTNKTTVLMSGAVGTSINSYNIVGEGTKKPAYDEFSIQTTGSYYWSRSAFSYATYYFCVIDSYGYIGSNSVYNTNGVRLGFRLG